MKRKQPPHKNKTNGLISVLWSYLDSEWKPINNTCWAWELHVHSLVSSSQQPCADRTAYFPSWCYFSTWNTLLHSLNVSSWLTIILTLFPSSTSIYRITLAPWSLSSLILNSNDYNLSISQGCVFELVISKKLTPFPALISSIPSLITTPPSAA